MAETSDAAITISCTLRLRRILDNDQLVALGDAVDDIHVGGLAIQMDRNDCGGARCDCRLNRCRIIELSRKAHGLEGKRGRRAPITRSVSSVLAQTMPPMLPPGCGTGEKENV